MTLTFCYLHFKKYKKKSKRIQLQIIVVCKRKANYLIYSGFFVVVAVGIICHRRFFFFWLDFARRTFESKFNRMQACTAPILSNQDGTRE